MSKSHGAERQHSSQKPKADMVRRNISLRRVSKVVKGGKRFSFSALAVLGDAKGRVGFGMGKAKEVSAAMKKAEDAASRNMVRIPLKEGRTIHGRIESKFGATKVVMRSGVKGQGVIAGGSMRAICEVAGIKDVAAKIIGSNNPHNVVRAALSALTQTETPRSIAFKRGKKMSELYGVSKNQTTGDAESQSL